MSDKYKYGLFDGRDTVTGSAISGTCVGCGKTTEQQRYFTGAGWAYICCDKCYDIALGKLVEKVKP